MRNSHLLGVVSACLFMLFTTYSNASLIITGLIDGPITGGLPKAVELYATSNIADLSIYGLGTANNGGGSDGEEFTLSGSANAGDFLYIATESVEFMNFFGFAPNFTDGTATNFNGNDAVELFQNGSVIDVFGDINVDGTGQPWEYMDGWAYRVSGTGPDGASFALSNWTFSGINALDNEISNATASTPFPLGTYTAVVPVPAAVWLFGSGFLYLIRIARRKNAI